MLSNLDLAMYGFLAVILLPIVISSLATGSKPPERSVFAKYYRAEPWLGLAANVFLLILCAQAVAKLAMHFGLITPSWAEAFEHAVNIPFLMMLLVVIVLWVRAIMTIRQAPRDVA
jgi:hypothetical protein